MGRAPCCDKANVKRGPWSPEEDDALRNYVEKHGSGGSWISLPQKAGLKRCGKSCRLRWLNYLRPDIKHGGFTEEEDNIIYTLYQRIGSRWSVIASQLPGRTDNDIKNYWNTKLKKRIMIVSQSNLPTATAAAATSTLHSVVRTGSTPPLIIPTVKIESYNCDDFMPPPPPFPEDAAVLLEHSGLNTSACGESYINGFLAEFGLGSPGELLGGYNYANLEKKGEHDANFGPLGNMWVTGDTKPKGLFQYS